jgi:general secretion pathway protein N
MMRKILLTLGILVAILVALVITAPAGLAWRVARSHAGPLGLEGVSGSVWQGQAAMLTLYNNGLGQVTWRVSPWSLLAGRLDGEVKVDGSVVGVDATLAGSTAAPQVLAARADFPAQVLAPAIDLPGLKLLGDVHVEMDRIELRDGLPYAAVGKATWRDLGLTGMAEAHLPGIGAEIGTPSEGRIEIKLSDLGGPLAVSGHSQVVNGTFDAEVLLSQRGENPTLAQALTFIGERTADGGTLLRIHGTIERMK